MAARLFSLAATIAVAAALAMAPTTAKAQTAVAVTPAVYSTAQPAAVTTVGWGRGYYGGYGGYYRGPYWGGGRYYGYYAPRPRAYVYGYAPVAVAPYVVPSYSYYSGYAPYTAYYPSYPGYYPYVAPAPRVGLRLYYW